MKKNLIATVKQKIQETKVIKNTTYDFSVLFYTKAGDYEKLSIVINHDKVFLNAIYCIMPFIQINIYSNGGYSFDTIITGTAEQYNNVLKYLIFVREFEGSKLVNSIIKLIYSHFNANHFSDLIHNGILNKSSFLYHEPTVQDNQIIFMDSLFEHATTMDPVSTIQFIIGNNVFDIIHVYKRSGDILLEYSIREIFMNNMDERLQDYACKRCMHLGYDLREHLSEVWSNKLNHKEEDIDEVIETVEETNPED